MPESKILKGSKRTEDKVLKTGIEAEFSVQIG
jgi:hypothetical protein